MRLIDADELLERLIFVPSDMFTNRIRNIVKEQPTVDAVPVVRCHECILHDNCNTEEAYKLCRIENPFCCVGKRMEPQAEAVEENNFFMERFMKQE